MQIRLLKKKHGVMAYLLSCSLACQHRWTITEIGLASLACQHRNIAGLSLQFGL
jgi:hypothetical protein